MEIRWHTVGKEIGRHIDEEVMDRIDGYLLLELLNWLKRQKELYIWIGCIYSYM